VGARKERGAGTGALLKTSSLCRGAASSNQRLEFARFARRTAAPLRCAASAQPFRYASRD